MTVAVRGAHCNAPADKTTEVDVLHGLFAQALPRLISYVSQVMTLLPGDVVLTGTPAGVGPIRPGQRVECTIEGLGTLANPVTEAEGLSTAGGPS